MTYREAKKYKVGDIAQVREEGNTNRVITNIEYIGKDIFMTVDNGKRVIHKLINEPIISSSSPFYCSWSGWVTSIVDAGITRAQAKKIGIVCEKGECIDD